MEEGRIQPSQALNTEFCASPCRFIAQRIHKAYKCQPPRTSHLNEIRVVCISDTHNAHDFIPTLPPGDVLIHSGDLTNSGSSGELFAALTWLLSAQPHPHKLFIAGNHDTILAEADSRSSIQSTFPDLQDSSASLTISGRTLNFYGSPHTPRHGNWKFQYSRVSALQASSSTVWSSIPQETDVLITHGPPAYYLDMMRAGYIALLDAVRKIRPVLHVFGHIHAARGVECVEWTDAQLAYEKICTGQGGWRNLVTILFVLLRKIWMRGSPAQSLQSQYTTMVNASVMGGLRDDRINEAIVIDI